MVILFLLFVVVRIFFQAYIIFAYAIEWLNYMWFEKQGVSTLYKLILVEMAIAVLSNVILNYYWTWNIVKQLLRIITRGSELAQKKAKKAPEELAQKAKKASKAE